jgi:hypothetical protein
MGRRGRTDAGRVHARALLSPTHCRPTTRDGARARESKRSPHRLVDSREICERRECVRVLVAQPPLLDAAGLLQQRLRLRVAAERLRVIMGGGERWRWRIGERGGGRGKTEKATDWTRAGERVSE